MPSELKETLGCSFVYEDRSAGRYIELEPESAEFKERFEELAQSLTTLLKSLKESISPTPSSPPPTANQIECPYRGLEVFEEEHSHLFFGRDSFIAAIEQKLHKHQFIAVVGPSGSGKSSVVQAGVFPRLGNEWSKLVFQPGDNPFLNLADKFVEMRGVRFRHFSERSKAVESVAKQIRDNRSIAATVAEVLAALPQPRHLLLVADQFEELFTLTQTADRQPFVEALLAVSHLADLNVLVTLRADFYGQAISLTPELSQWLQDGVVNHRPLQRADWEAVILQPAKTAGLSVDHALVALILEEIEAQPDSLPLLEYALKELWLRREQNRIGIAQYEALGKLTGAINQRADAVLAQLSEEERKLALRALTRLVRISGGEEEGADTRLRLPMEELTPEQREVLQSFINERLLVTNRHDQIGEETIEVAHEALIRRWEKLQEALDNDREFLLWRRRLNSRRREWEKNQRHESLLLRGVVSDEAKNWMNKRGNELTNIETDFISWEDRPEFHIDQILIQGPELVPFSSTKVFISWFTTLIICGEKEKAIISINKIEAIRPKASAIRALAGIFVKNGLLTEALSLAQTIKFPDLRAYTLNSITEELIKVDRLAEAAASAKEALSVVQNMQDADDRANALSLMADSLVILGLQTEALSTASGFGYAGNYAIALSSIAKALAKAGFKAEARKATNDAFIAAQVIEYLDDREVALSVVAQALAEAHLISEAITAVRLIKSSVTRTKVLNSLVETWVKAGFASEALSAARLIDKGFFRTNALSLIVKTFIHASTKGEASLVLNEAIDAARLIKDPEQKVKSLASIAQAIVNSDLNAEAFGIAQEALASIDKIEISDRRARALQSLNHLVVKMDMTTVALNVARTIGDVVARSRALNSVAEMFLKTGRVNETHILCKEILSNASQIKLAVLRGRIMGTAAKTLAQSGASVEALIVAQNIKNIFSRSKIMIRVINHWLKEGQHETAANLIDEVSALTSKIFKDIDRSVIFKLLTNILARMHSFRAARETAEQCFSSDDRLAAYTAILREYHIERNPSLTQLFAEETTEEEDDDD